MGLDIRYPIGLMFGIIGLVMVAYGLLTGGVWCQIDMRFEYDEETKGKHPFWIEKLTPIQIATFDLEEYRRLRREFTTDEWIDILVNSCGLDPEPLNRRKR